MHMNGCSRGIACESRAAGESVAALPRGPARSAAADSLGKDVFDRLLAAILLILCLPLLALLVFLVRLTSRGPGIFAQVRVGKNGRHFTLYKIRTMRQDAERGTGAVWATEDDPRITRVGRVLRDLHLDELPQLFNVLKGEMSLVGPRPERPEFVTTLAKAIPGYLDRLSVRPGITGLAQLNLPPDSDLDSVRRKLVLDLEYIEHAGPLLDLRLLAGTVARVLRIRAERVLGIQRRVSLAGPRATPAGAGRTPDSEPKGGPNGEGPSLVPAADSPPSLAARRLPVEPGSSPSAPVSSPSAPSRPSPPAMTVRGPINALTIDVEDYFQVTAFEREIDRDRWDGLESRVVRNTHRVLAVLGRHGVHATFFVLGWVAERFPALIREIDAAGHEIGSHGYWHRLVYSQTPDEFRDDVRKSRDALEDLVGHSVRAYRAPSFSITARSLWALDVLLEEGFLIDSSVFPIRHDRYGIPDAEPFLHQIAAPAGRLWEFPPATVRMLGRNFPVGGGGYFRLFPLRWTLRALTRINRVARQPFAFYLHPWELDPQQPRLRAGSRISRFRHCVNLSRTERRLECLLRQVPFARMADIIPERELREGIATGAQPLLAYPVRTLRVDGNREIRSTWRGYDHSESRRAS